MSTDITPIGQSNVPEYMRGERVGTEGLAEYLVPPSLKIVQKQSGDNLKEKFNEGDVILMPFQMLIAKIQDNNIGTPFFFTPIMRYTEWCKWSPIQMRGMEPAILGRTLDENHEIAIKAKNEETRQEPHPSNPKLNVRYVEHINFLIVMAGDHELSGTPMLLSFSKGEHFRGRMFCTLISMSHASIYGRVYKGEVGRRESQGNTWYGIDVTNPDTEAGDPAPWVPQDVYKQYAAVHAEYAKAYEAGLVRAEYDEQHEEDAQPADTAKF